MDCLPTLFTDRLVLTPLTLDDVPAIQALFPQWEVVRYLDCRVPWPYPNDGALVYVRDIALPAMAAGQEWHWMIRLREEGERSIGSISLYEQPGNNRGFWLAPQWWGRGYMREACGVINAYWFETLARPLMAVPKAVANHASRKVSEHEGMRRVAERDGQFVSGPMRVETWEMTRSEWLRSKTGGRPAGIALPGFSRPPPTGRTMAFESVKCLLDPAQDNRSPMQLLGLVLQACIELVSIPGNDFCWSFWADEREAIQELQGLLEQVRAGTLPDRLQLTVLFAPTGPLQETSMGSGWAETYLKVAGRFDEAEALLW